MKNEDLREGNPPADNIVVGAMYKFVSLPDYKELRSPLLAFLQKNDIKGTILLAEEGINGTVAGRRESMDNLIAWLKSDTRFDGISYKESYDEKMPFHRTKVRLKKEIVTMGVNGIDPNNLVGRYVPPAEWNALITDPDVLLIDTRNDYEYQIGTFKNALNPDTETFREFPEYLTNAVEEHKPKKVAMFCTGGIRCEKSTAYLRGLGFDEVYHLQGGILKYLEEVPADDSTWEGECFVFDNRVSVNHQLEKGIYDQCFACRMPITEEEKEDPRYEQGVSCLHCHDKRTPKQIARFREREKQMRLAEARGQSHVGDISADIEKRRAEKHLARMQNEPQMCGVDFGEADLVE